MKKQLFVTTFCTLLVAGYGCSSPQAESQPQDLTQYVDPYIGSGGHGHVFVGANVPYGLVQLGLLAFHRNGIGHRVIISQILP